MKCLSATASQNAPVHMRERLRLLRKHDLLRPWRRLTDQRTCLACGEVFTGIAITIVKVGSQVEFGCPTLACRGSLADFAVVGNPFEDDGVWQDWCKTLDDRQTSPPQIRNASFGAIGNPS